MPLTTYTKPIDPLQVPVLKSLLIEEGFDLGSKPYAFYSGKKGKLNVTVYEKGPKVLVQGGETEDFVRFHLEPKVFGKAELGYEEVTHPDWYEPHFGVDESGKGDALGPLVIAGAYTNKDLTQQLIDLGAADSKTIKSAQKMNQLAERIKAIKGMQYSIVLISPEKYNLLYEKFGNLNKLLAWGHATVISNLKEKQPDCPTALSDQFARSTVLEYALKQQKVDILLKQRTKAESDPAVAAASILARDAFVRWMENKGNEIGTKLPFGGGGIVNKKIRELSQKGESFNTLGKLHFKNFSNL